MNRQRNRGGGTCCCRLLWSNIEVAYSCQVVLNADLNVLHLIPDVDLDHHVLVIQVGAADDETWKVLGGDVREEILELWCVSGLAWPLLPLDDPAQPCVDCMGVQGWKGGIPGTFRSDVCGTWAALAVATAVGRG